MVKRIGATLMLTVGLIFVLASSAQAAPAIPGAPDCAAAPAAQMPGRGVSGILDSAPNPLPPAGDPFAQHPTTSVYEQYGYAGLHWSNYDLGCMPGLENVDPTTDTMLGNWGLSFATAGVAAANGIHNKIAHPSAYMAPLDNVVDDVTGKVKATIWTPWGAVALLVVVVLLLWHSAAGSLSSVTKGAGWAVFVVVLVAGASQAPASLASFFDTSVTGAIAQVDAGSAGITRIPTGSDPARAQGALVVDRLLYDAWLRGEFGAPDTAAAKAYGPRLFKASAYTWAEAAQAADPAKAQTLADQKAADWKAVAEEIKAKNPGGTNLQGKLGGRNGIGLMTVFGVAFTNLFRIVADLFVFAGLMMLRLLVMFFPIIAVAGLLKPQVMHRVGNIAAASVINVVAFSAGAAIQTTIIAALLSNARLGGMNIIVLILSLVTTVVAFVLLRPLLSFSSIIGFAPKQGMHGLKKAAKAAARLAPDVLPPSVGAVVGADGAANEQDVKADPNPKQGPVAESFSRPQQEDPQKLVAVTAERPITRPAESAPLEVDPVSDHLRREKESAGSPVLYDPQASATTVAKQPVEHFDRWVFDPATKSTSLVAGHNSKMEISK